MNNQLVEHFDRHELLSEKQFGFRKGVSTEQLILSVTDHFNRILDAKSPKYITHLSLDVRKAFDSVHHDLLLHKLSNLFYLSEPAVRLFRSYLSSRHQCMKVGSAVSQLLPISKGVPQGSVLGPLLFNVMVNDMLASYDRVYSLLMTRSYLKQLTQSTMLSQQPAIDICLFRVGILQMGSAYARRKQHALYIVTEVCQRTYIWYLMTISPQSRLLLSY